MLLHLVVLPWVVNWISKVSATVTEYWHFNVHSSQTNNSNLNPRFSCGRVSNGLKLKLNSILSGGQSSSQQFFRLEVTNPSKLHMISLTLILIFQMKMYSWRPVIGELFDCCKSSLQCRTSRWEDRTISLRVNSSWSVKDRIEYIVLGSHCFYFGCLNWWQAFSLVGLWFFVMGSFQFWVGSSIPK